jgi:hypothetical protein
MNGHASEPRTIRMEINNDIKFNAGNNASAPKTFVHRSLWPFRIVAACVFASVFSVSLPDQLADAFGCHQLKNVFPCEAKEIALGGQLKRAHCHSVLQPANEISFQ